MSGPTATTIVVGASRGFGAATADALADTGGQVIALSRGSRPADTRSGDRSEAVTSVTGDGRDPSLARQLLADHRPTALVIGGGAVPHMAPLEQHTFETLSLHWHHDVAIVFTWLQAVLTAPEPTLETVVTISSGAGVFGSPGSGGFAGAKATTRLLTSAAANSAERLGIDMRLVTVNPKLTGGTDLGRAAIAGYAALTGTGEGQPTSAPPIYSADHAGRLIAGLVTSPTDHPYDDYLLTEDGLTAL